MLVCERHSHRPLCTTVFILSFNSLHGSLTSLSNSASAFLAFFAPALIAALITFFSASSSRPPSKRLALLLLLPLQKKSGKVGSGYEEGSSEFFKPIFYYPRFRRKRQHTPSQQRPNDWEETFRFLHDTKTTNRTEGSGTNIGLWLPSPCPLKIISGCGKVRRILIGPR